MINGLNIELTNMNTKTNLTTGLGMSTPQNFNPKVIITGKTDKLKNKFNTASVLIALRWVNLLEFLFGPCGCVFDNSAQVGGPSNT